MDTIFIRGLKLTTLIGVHAWERVLPRPLLIDVELGTDIRAAAASDQVADALDYAAVAASMVARSQALQPQLLETLAEQLALGLFDDFAAVQQLRLTIHKPGAVPGTQSVGVTIERRREA